MYSKSLTLFGTAFALVPLPARTHPGPLPMTDQTLPCVTTEAEAKPISNEKLLIAVLLGVGGVATFGWVGLVGWGVIYLIGSLTG